MITWISPYILSRNAEIEDAFEQYLENGERSWYRIYICVCFYSLCIIIVEEIFVLLTLANIKQMPLIDRLYMKIIVQYILLEQQRLFIFYFKWKFWKKNFLYTRRKQLNKFWLFRLLMIGLIVASLFSLASNNINSSTCNKHFYFKIRGTIDIIRSLNI
jgi:hypothetical protein